MRKVYAILTMIYCYAIIFIAGPPAFGYLQNNPYARNAEFFEVTSIKISYHTSQSESLVNSFTNFSAPTFKIQGKEYSALSNALRQLFATEFSQYIFLSKNLLVELHKTQIIFPFHYFW